MKFFLVITILILIIATLFLFFRKNNYKQNQQQKKKNLMLHLNDLEKEIKNFNEEKEMKPLEIIEMEKEISTLLDKVVEGDISIKELEKQAAISSKKIEQIKLYTKEQYRRKEQIKKTVLKEVNSFKSFLEKNHVYPKDYLFSANKLQGYLVDLDKEKGQTLVTNLNTIESFLKSFQKDMKKFTTIHTQVTNWLNKSPEVFANDKQKLIFYLNNGELDKAESLFHQIINNKEFPEKEITK